MFQPHTASGRSVRVYGLDFSGGVRAGDKIWLAGGAFDGERLQIEHCLRGADLPGSGIDRERCLTALRTFISRLAVAAVPSVGGSEPAATCAGARDVVAIGCDFPFALPLALMGDDGWESFLRGFAGRYPDADSFRAACIQATGGRELRRRCDVESRTPFSAYNLRLYRQTHAGIAGVLAPLVQADSVRVLPMQPPDAGRPWLLEVCPASLLKRIGWYLPRYKGRGEQARRARCRILAALEETGRLALAHELRSPVLDNADGDALDSVIAAFATAEALREPARHAAATSPAYALEGYVYA